MKKLVYRLLAIMSVLSFFVCGIEVPFAAAMWESKVDAWVLETAAEGETEFLVYLTEQADLSAAKTLSTKLDKGWYVYRTLTDLAARTQKGLMAELDRLGVDYRPHWIANMVWVRGGMQVVREVAERSDVAHVYANPHVRLEALIISKGVEAAPETIEWNITKVGAPDVWAMGYTGQGVVIGGQDTGYQWDHPALINQYRGWDGATADHDYNWHDAIHESSGYLCGYNSPVPCDDSGHGTHTMGTMVGDDGGSNQIGMAPGAKWIGCRNMDNGVGTPETYSECYEWFVAPYPVGGTPADGDPSMAPDVINNSWGCPVSEGCNPGSLLTVVQNLVAAGIVTVHSAGNSGSGCSTVSTPAGIYAESFTVGATNSNDTIGSFSSRGPVTVDGSGRPKPDISAPGVSIRSSVPGDGYEGGWSGTSMAAPHVAGLVALMISAYPELEGEVDLTREAIEQTALGRTTTQTCGGDLPGQIPNNVYGWGRIRALEAVEYFYLGLDKKASPETVFPGENITYTLTISHPHGAAADTNVVLTDTIPLGTDFVSASEPYTLTGESVVWVFPTLDVSATLRAELVVQVEAGASWEITNQDYYVLSDQSERVMGNAVSTPVEGRAELEIVKSVSEDFAYPGDPITYTITITNHSEAVEATHLVLTDTLPEGSSFISASLPYTRSGEVIRWDFDSLGTMSSLQVQLVVRVEPGVTGLITNQEYAAWADQAGVVSGEPVSTALGRVFFLPVVVWEP